MLLQTSRKYIMLKTFFVSFFLSFDLHRRILLGVNGLHNYLQSNMKQKLWTFEAKNYKAYEKANEMLQIFAKFFV